MGEYRFAILPSSARGVYHRTTPGGGQFAQAEINLAQEGAGRRAIQAPPFSIPASIRKRKLEFGPGLYELLHDQGQVHKEGFSLIGADVTMRPLRAADPPLVCGLAGGVVARVDGGRTED